MSRSKNARKRPAEGEPFIPESWLSPEIRFPEDDVEQPLVRHGLRGLRDARDFLPMAALREALGPAGLRRLKGQEGLAIVIQVPSPDWCDRIETALRGLADFAHVTARDGSSKLSHLPSSGNDKIADRLSAGARVAGISHAPERHLPETLMAAADLVVRIGPPSNRVLAETIRAATGKRPRKLPLPLAGSLPLDALTAQIRIGSTPRACVARLQAAAEARSGIDPLLGEVPPLESLFGYGGGAMTWANTLVRDIAEFRSGNLPWEAVQRSALFYGPPGTGKTTFVRAVAKAAGIPIVATSVSSWFTSSNGYLDGVLKSFMSCLHAASVQAPCLLFIDECDSIPNRETLSERGRDWWTPVVAGIIAELDSSTSGDASRLVVVGATNYLNALDPALIRPGRLFPPIEIPKPSAEDLAGILRQHLGADLPGEDLMPVAHLGAGGTGADAVAWVKAARSTARTAARRMIVADLAEAVAPPDGRSAEELRICALHEGAHALASVIDPGVGTLRSVSLAMRGSSAGATRASLVPRMIMTRAQIEALVVVTLAGRAMDALNGAANTGAGGGAGSDLERATEMVAAMHASYGLGDGLMFRGAASMAVQAMRGDPTLRRAVERDLQALYARALAVCRDNRPAIEAIAERLLAKRVLSGDEVERIVREHGKPVRAVTRGGRDAR